MRLSLSCSGVRENAGDIVLAPISSAPVPIQNAALSRVAATVHKNGGDFAPRAGNPDASPEVIATRRVSL